MKDIIKELPKEITENILEYLTYKGLLMLSMASKKHNEDKYEEKITSIELFNYTISRAKLSSIQDKLKNIKSISFISCKIEMGVLDLISDWNLNSLNISDQRNIENKQLMKIIDKSKELQSIFLCACPKITQESLNCIINLKHLKSVDLSGSIQINNTLIKNIIDNTENLTSLSLNGCKGINTAFENVTDKLSHLYLGSCQDLTDQTLNDIGQMTKLTHLDLSYCDNITDNGIKHILKIGLIYLNLSGCPINGEGFNTDENEGSLKSLRSLDLSNCKIIKNAKLKNFSNLNHLGLDITFYDDIKKHGCKYYGPNISMQDLVNMTEEVVEAYGTIPPSANNMQKIILQCVTAGNIKAENIFCELPKLIYLKSNGKEFSRAELIASLKINTEPRPKTPKRKSQNSNKQEHRPKKKLKTSRKIW